MFFIYFLFLFHTFKINTFKKRSVWKNMIVSVNACCLYIASYIHANIHDDVYRKNRWMDVRETYIFFLPDLLHTLCSIMLFLTVVGDDDGIIFIFVCLGCSRSSSRNTRIKKPSYFVRVMLSHSCIHRYIMVMMMMMIFFIKSILIHSNEKFILL